MMSPAPPSFEDYVANELRAGDRRMDEIGKTISEMRTEQEAMRRALDEQHKLVNEMRKNTQEMLEVFQSWKGAMRVLEWIGRAAKPLIWIIGLGSAFFGFITVVKSGINPPR